jgi:hypothetical protein
MRLKIITTLLVLGSASQLSATNGPLKARELYESCKFVDKDTPPLSSHASGYCLGFLEGFLNGAQSYGSVTSGTFTMLQVDQVSYGQINRVFLRFVEQNPKYEGIDAGAVLIMALVDAKLARFVPTVLEKKSEN